MKNMKITDTMRRPKSPQQQDEESIGGSMPDPESDDDVLRAAHAMGIALSDDYEHPRELNIAKDINRAQRRNKSQ